MDDDSDRGGEEDEKEGREGGEVRSSATGIFDGFRYGMVRYAMLCGGILCCTVLCSSLLIMLIMLC